MLKIVFSIHCNFFILSSIWLEICRSNELFFTRQNLRTRKIGCASVVLCKLLLNTCSNILKIFPGVLLRHIFRGGDLLGWVSCMITIKPWHLCAMVSLSSKIWSNLFNQVLNIRPPTVFSGKKSRKSRIFFPKIVMYKKGEKINAKVIKT